MGIRHTGWGATSVISAVPGPSATCGASGRASSVPLARILIMSLLFLDILKAVKHKGQVHLHLPGALARFRILERGHFVVLHLDLKDFAHGWLSRDFQAGQLVSSCTCKL